MNHLLDDEDDFAGQTNHRELTLSTGAILGIFVGLTLVCGLFFAFGYNMGKKDTPSMAAASDASASATPSTNFNSFKPSAGSPVGAPTSTPAPTGLGSSTTNGTAQTPHSASALPQNDETPSPRPSATPEPVAAPAPAQAAVPVRPPTAAPTPEPASGNFLVQVAAVSHQEDADLLVGALKGKGYAVAARTEPQDKLVHIQVGPFSNHKDAEAMRQKLLNDGYNAIVK